MKQLQQPLDFCLIIPCYNNLAGLVKSLRTVQYDASKFCILVVDDGSDEPILPTHLIGSVPDGCSLQIIRIPLNAGITRALNAGLEVINNARHIDFVARLDCGDLCAPERFYKQVQFLRAQPGIDLVGSWCIFYNPATGRRYQYKTATSHQQLVRGMHFKNMFIHPTVMWRNRKMEELKAYPEQFPHAEDYGFFYRILNRSRCAVIPENLVSCELNPLGISMRFRRQQLKSRMRVVKSYGKSNVFRFAGVLKLWMLLLIPDGLIPNIKQALYGMKV